MPTTWVRQSGDELAQGDNMSTLQTLDRGIQTLKIVGRRGGLTIAELAGELGVARANCYRIVATLATHGLVLRGRDGRIRLAAGVPELASQYWSGLVGRAEVMLQELADRTGATGLMAVVEHEQVVVVACTQPRRSDVARLGFPIGFRQPLHGAPGVAILSARPEREGDSEAVQRARRLGYATSEGEIQAGLVEIVAAVPHGVRGYAPESCLGLVAPTGLDVETVGPLVAAVARSLSEERETTR